MCKNRRVSEEYPEVECPECGEMAPPIERCLHCNTDFRALGLDRSGDFTGADDAASGQAEAVFESDEEEPLPERVDSSQPGDIEDEAADEPAKPPSDEKQIWEEVFSDDDGPSGFFERHRRLIWITLVVLVVGGAIIAALVVMTPTLDESGEDPPLGDIPGYHYVGD